MNAIVPKAAYHVAVKFSGQGNRTIAHFRTVVEPYIDIQFPLPDSYKNGDSLTENDEILLSLMFNQIVQARFQDIRTQQQIAEFMKQQQEKPAQISHTQAVLADMEDDVIELTPDDEDSA